MKRLRNWGIRRLSLNLFVACALGQQPGTIAIDQQEWRAAPVRHFYIHGILNGDTAFHVYMPDAAQWQGRLFQYLEGGIGGSEMAGVRMGNHAYVLANGGVYVESSQGHIGTTFYEDNNTPNELSYEASYAVVQYAKARCVELYGKEPDYSYIWGGSGGGVRSTGLIERFPKVYDGAVPVVGAGNLFYFTYLQSMFETYRPIIQDRIPAVAEVTRVPGQGDPFAVLDTPQQKEALRMVLATGYPRNSLWLVRPLTVGITAFDFMKYKAYPQYFDDFWTQPGYAGADGEFRNQVVDGVEGVVKSISPEKRFLTTDVSRPDDALYGYTLVFTSGGAKGQWRRVLTNRGALLALGHLGPGVTEVKPGDRFTLNNRDLLAWRAVHRYLADDPQDPAMRHLFVNGKPRYRQIPAGELKDETEVGRRIGHFQGKMIMVFGTDDPLMWPTVAARYHRRVKQAWGAAADQHFRLHFLEHGVHGAPLATALHRQIPNQAAVRKALDQMMAWVERGVAPAAGTAYTVDDMSQISLPQSAAMRRGYQPLVTLSAQARGADLKLSVAAADPDNEIVRIEMDWQGDGKFDESREMRGREIKAEFRHHYEKSGTYYPAVRVTDATSSAGSEARGVPNVACVRVVVP